MFKLGEISSNLVKVKLGHPQKLWAGTLANLHIQKAGGTAQFKNCEQHCLEARRRLDLNALGHDVWSVAQASGTRCGCEALFDHHWGAAELEAIQLVARAMRCSWSS